MQVSAISSSQGFTGSRHSRENINNFIALDNEQLKDIAYAKTVKDYQRKQKNSRRLYAAVPLIGALTAGILSKGKSSLFGVEVVQGAKVKALGEVSGLAARVVDGLKGGAYWGGLLALGFGVSKVMDLLADKSPKAREKMANHPLLTMAAQLGTLFAGVMYIPRGLGKLYKTINPEYIAKAARGVENIGEHINRAKAPEFVKNATKVVSDVTPDCVKDISKKILAYAPDITLITAFFNTMRTAANGSYEFSKNYTELRDKQKNLANARLSELSNI